ncbi:2OG-Fe(II) oxygenase family protein [Rhodovibrionaceae bacterium A322]
MPSSRDQQLQLARLYEKQGALAEAEQTYEDLLLQGAADPEVYLALADLQELRRSPERAQTSLQRCLQDHPDHEQATLKLGTLLERNKNWTAARDLYLQTLARNENLPTVLLALGRVLQAMGQMEDALSVCQRCHDADPNWMPAREAYCRALLTAGNPREAWDLARQGCEEPSATAELFDLLGQAGQRIGQPDGRNLKAAFAALQRDPHRVAVYARMVPMLRRQGREEEAALLYNYGRLLYWRPQSQATGYLKMEEFHRDLCQELADQSQLTGDLLQRRSGVLQTLEILLEQGAKEYLQLVSGLAGHPYFIRPPAAWQLSVQPMTLQPSDYRSPEISEASYLSGFYFVQVPPEVSASSGEAGCVRFFDSSVHDEAMRFETLRPKEGLLVFYPSYFWCGTIPFAAEGPVQALSVQVKEKPANL